MRTTTLQLVSFSFEINWGPKSLAEVLIFWNSNLSNNLGWQNNQNQSCRSRLEQQICSLWLFHLKPFRSQIFILNLEKWILGKWICYIGTNDLGVKWLKESEVGGFPRLKQNSFGSFLWFLKNSNHHGLVIRTNCDKLVSPPIANRLWWECHQQR
jgi:hypothetical protein